MPRLRKGSAAYHRMRASLPKADPGGIYIHDHEAHRDTFVSYNDLHLMCKDMMHPANAAMMKYEFGKMHYSEDPTYNMKRRK